MKRAELVCRISGVIECEVKSELPFRKPPKRPSQCRKYVQQRLTDALPGMIDDFVKEPKQVSCQRLKLTAELLETPPEKRGAGGSRTLSKWVKAMRPFEKNRRELS